MYVNVYFTLKFRLFHLHLEQNLIYLFCSLFLDKIWPETAQIALTLCVHLVVIMKPSDGFSPLKYQTSL